ncbi:MAG: serine/threonine protein kinase [Phototrophicaceae bacterium]
MKKLKGVSIGQYIVGDVLSDNGGMATIYKATTSDRNATVALKLARVDSPENNSIYEQLLLKETELLRDLRHPCVVRILPLQHFNRVQFYARIVDLAADQENHVDAPWCFAMEYLAGGRLVDWIQNKRLNLAWRVELIYQLATTLDYLHLRKIAHRDIKPDNIMFRVEPHPNSQPMPVLIDFGLSEKRKLEPEVSATTISHAAPELVQAMMQQENMVNQDFFAIDVWALGIVAVELLTGQHPFMEGLSSPSTIFNLFGSKHQPPLYNRQMLMERIAYEPPIILSEVIPVKLLNLIQQMLDKNPHNRPTIEQIIHRLETEIELFPPRIPPNK